MLDLINSGGKTPQNNKLSPIIRQLGLLRLHLKLPGNLIQAEYCETPFRKRR